MQQYLTNLWLTLQAIWTLLVPFRRTLLICAGVLLAIEVHAIGEVYLSAVAIYLATHEVSSTMWFITIAAFLLADELYVWLDTARHWYVDFALRYPVAERFRILALKKFHELDYLWHQQNNPSVQIAKVREGVEKILRVLNQAAWDFFPGLMRLMLSLGPLLYFAPWTAIILMITTVIFMWLTVKVHIVNELHRKQRQILNEKELEAVYFAASHVGTAQIFGQSSRIIQEYQELYQQIVALGCEETVNKQWNYRWRNRIVMWSRLAVWMTLAYQCQNHTASWFFPSLQPTQLVFVGFLAEKIFYAFWNFNHLFDEAAESKEGTERLINLLNEPTRPIARGTHYPNGTGIGIEFDHVSFRYTDTTEHVIDDLSFSVQPGEILAIVGESGAGKSTVQALLSGQLEPQVGEIRLGGVPICDWSPDALGQVFSFVPQGNRIAIENASIDKNIAYADILASSEDIQRAAQRAGIHEFAISSPDGYQTVVGERGIKLSGGQIQRVALARAILPTNRCVLIMDEATSSIDVLTEQYIQENLRQILVGKTVIIVAHRLSTIWDIADRILVLGNGRKLEMGTHQELIALGGVYAELVRCHDSSAIK